jgi:hypothetical protein
VIFEPLERAEGWHECCSIGRRRRRRVSPPPRGGASLSTQRPREFPLTSRPLFFFVGPRATPVPSGHVRERLVRVAALVMAA